MTVDSVGIVVIGRNEGERLSRCLASLVTTQNKIVYVDSGSTDDSVARAERFGALIVELDPNHRFTAARARNEGFAALRRSGDKIEFVQFIDGDCALNPQWLPTALSFLIERNEVAVVCGRRRERFPDETIYNKICDLEWDTPIGQAASVGGDFLVRTEAFEMITGFRPELMAGEEPEMCARLREKGLQIWRIGAEMTEHDVRLKMFSQWWRRIVRSGYGYAEVLNLLATSPYRIYQREVARAVIWAGILPILILALGCSYPGAFVLLLFYPLQVFRIAVRSRSKNIDSGTYAFFMMLAKFAEFQGIMTFWLHKVSGVSAKSIEYKAA